jgi:hypothetical protein
MIKVNIPRMLYSQFRIQLDQLIAETKKVFSIHVHSAGGHYWAEAEVIY